MTLTRSAGRGPSVEERGAVWCGRVCVLDADPDLGSAVPEAARGHARSASVADVLDWSAGATPPAPGDRLQGAFGLLILGGAVASRFQHGGRTRSELLGPEDLLQPWTLSDCLLGSPVSMSWEIVEPVRLAVLDRRWSVAMSPWPEVAALLLERLVLRSRRLCFQMTAAGNAVGEARVRLMLWQLAERWGRVTPDGILLDVALSHRLIAEMTGSTRPTVTAAITKMRRAGQVEALPGRRLLLRGRAAEEKASR